MKDIECQAIRALGKDIEIRLSFEKSLLTDLWAKQIITDMERRAIEVEQLSEHKTRKLLTTICMKDHEEYDVFETFCVALEEDEQQYLANMLRKKVQELETKRNHRPSPSVQSSNTVGGAAAAAASSGPCSDRDEEKRLKTIITQNMPELVESLTVEYGLYEHLIKHGVLMLRTKNSLGQGTKEEKATKLLEYLLTRPEEDIVHFVHALRKTNQSHLAKLFDK